MLIANIKLRLSFLANYIQTMLFFLLKLLLKGTQIQARFLNDTVPYWPRPLVRYHTRDGPESSHSNERCRLRLASSRHGAYQQSIYGCMRPGWLLFWLYTKCAIVSSSSIRTTGTRARAGTWARPPAWPAVRATPLGNGVVGGRQVRRRIGARREGLGTPRASAGRRSRGCRRRRRYRRRVACGELRARAARARGALFCRGRGRVRAARRRAPCRAASRRAAGRCPPARARAAWLRRGAQRLRTACAEWPRSCLETAATHPGHPWRGTELSENLVTNYSKIQTIWLYSKRHHL
jgi:hypothetical protein